MSDTPPRRPTGVRARRSAVDHIADHGETRELPDLVDGSSIDVASISTSTFSIVPQALPASIDEDLLEDDEVVASEIDPAAVDDVTLDDVRVPITDAPVATRVAPDATQRDAGALASDTKPASKPVAPTPSADAAPPSKTAARKPAASTSSVAGPAATQKNSAKPAATKQTAAKRTAAKQTAPRPSATKAAPTKAAATTAESAATASSSAEPAAATSPVTKPAAARRAPTASTTAKSAAKNASATSSARKPAPTKPAPTTPAPTSGVKPSSTAETIPASTNTTDVTEDEATGSSSPVSRTAAPDRTAADSPTPEATASDAVAATLPTVTPSDPAPDATEDSTGPASEPLVHLASTTIVVDLPPTQEPDVPDDERALAIDEVPVTSDERARTTTSSVTVSGEGPSPAEEDDRVDETPAPPAYTGMSVARALAGAPESASMLTAERLLDQGRDARRVPEGFWQKLLFDVSGRRIRLSDSKAARARTALTERIATPLTGGARFVPVLTRKGGVGKTTITTLMGMALADARDDRVIAVDANPDRGTLAERLTRRSEHTVRDLVRGADDVAGYAEFSALVSRDATRLDVLASDSDPHISQAFAEEDYDVVARLASQYYSLILTDCGTGIVHSVMGATLRHADTLVVVSGTSIDEARSASETLSWLEANGYPELAASAVVVINSTTPGTPPVRLDEIEKHFESRVRNIVRVPFDAHLATGAAITFADLRPETRQAVRELAAAVVEGLPGVRDRKAGSRV